ncbi:hypothetical protein BH11PAT1_BH11PAT1_5890 [soil metagenome]
MKRSYIHVIILVALIAFPFWIYVPLIVVATLYEPFFYEAIIYGFFIDILYGAQTYNSYTLVFPFALGLSILVVTLLPLRQYIRVDHV